MMEARRVGLVLGLCVVLAPLAVPDAETRLRAGQHATAKLAGQVRHARRLRACAPCTRAKRRCDGTRAGCRLSEARMPPTSDGMRMLADSSDEQTPSNLSGDNARRLADTHSDPEADGDLDEQDQISAAFRRWQLSFDTPRVAPFWAMYARLAAPVPAAHEVYRCRFCWPSAAAAEDALRPFSSQGREDDLGGESTAHKVPGRLRAGGLGLSEDKSGRGQGGKRQAKFPFGLVRYRRVRASALLTGGKGRVSSGGTKGFTAHLAAAKCRGSQVWRALLEQVHNSSTEIPLHRPGCGLLHNNASYFVQQPTRKSHHGVARSKPRRLCEREG